MRYERVVVIRGGVSEEYKTSMQTGASVLNSLKRQDFFVKDVVITRSGEWLESGFVKKPSAVLEGIDVAFLALHGAYGEDGEIQKLLQRHRIKFNGSDALSSALSFNKSAAKKTLTNYGVLTPRHIVIDVETYTETDETELIEKILESVGNEMIIKPLNSGSSIGIEFANDRHELSLQLQELFLEYDELIIEEYICGRETTCAVLENFRDQPLYTFPAVEIIYDKKHKFFTSEAKYDGQTSLICPANFNFKQRSTITDTTANIHKLLGLSQYSRCDFILRDDDLFFLEVNTLPGLTENSLYPKSAEAVGLSFDQLIAHLVTTAKC